jgi:hypothetical protein
MIDSDIKQTIRELQDTMKLNVIEKINSHLYSLQRKIEDLTISRDKWKEKYTEMAAIYKLKWRENDNRNN